MVMRIRKRFMGTSFALTTKRAPSGFHSATQCGLAKPANISPKSTVNSFFALKSCPSAVSNRMVVEMWRRMPTSTPFKAPKTSGEAGKVPAMAIPTRGTHEKTAIQIQRRKGDVTVAFSMVIRASATGNLCMAMPNSRAHCPSCA